MPFAPIPELLAEIQAGRMVVILDDEDRENEGDLIMAASLVRPEDINFMARHARGLICLALLKERCEQLRLPPMVQDNRSPHRTNFTVSIEAAEGVSTGISAYDRAHTVRTAVRPDAKPEHLTQPGHIFPLTAHAGGVLSRAGHTEAAVDLARLAGLEPAGVLVEILNDDGSMARRVELEVFADQHQLKLGSIADLIRYRMQTELTLTRVLDRLVQTEFGEFRLVAYREAHARGIHYALVKGEVVADQALLTRVQAKDLLTDVLHLKREDLHAGVGKALAAVAKEGRGIVVVLDLGQDPAALLKRLEQGEVAASPPSAALPEWREHGLGAQILADLGARRLRVIGTPRRYLGLAGFGLEIVEHVALPG